MIVKIVTDSTADLPAELANELGITIVPLYVCFGKAVYRDRVDISEDDFYKRLLQDSTHPTTTQPTPQDFAEVDQGRLERLIRSTGYYRNKAGNLKKCAMALVENHGGVVPNTLEQLVKLPGVGRKTANVVLGAAFGVPGIVVDTHVSRISQRLGLTSNKDPVKIEFDLMEIVPKSDWDGFSLRLIYFGRQFCRARSPLCADCPVRDFCEWPGKTV